MNMLVSADSDDHVVTKLYRRKMNFIYPNYGYKMYPENAFKKMTRVVMTNEGFICKTRIY